MTQNMYLKSTLLSMLIFSMLLLVGLELVYADYWEGNIFILEADRTVIKKGNFSMTEKMCCCIVNWSCQL